MRRIFVLFFASMLAAKLEANTKVYIHTVSSIILRSNIIGRLRKRKKVVRKLPFKQEDKNIVAHKKAML